MCVKLINQQRQNILETEVISEENRILREQLQHKNLQLTDTETLIKYPLSQSDSNCWSKHSFIHEFKKLQMFQSFQFSCFTNMIDKIY
jgi:hypothetical protein